MRRHVLAEHHLDERRRRGVRDRQAADEAPVPQDANVVGDLPQLLQAVRDIDDRHALPG